MDIDDDYSRKLPKNDSYYGRQQQESKSTSNNLYYYGASPPEETTENRYGGKKQGKDFGLLSGKKRKINVKRKGFEQSSLVLEKRANRFGNNGLYDTASTSSTLLSSSAVGVGNYDKYMGKGLIGGLAKLDE